MPSAPTPDSNSDPEYESDHAIAADAVADEAHVPVDSCTLPNASVVIHEEHPFQRSTTYIDVESEHGTVETQIRATSLELNGCELGGLDRALYLDSCRITLNTAEKSASILQTVPDS